MQCPVCSAELESGALKCASCGAIQIVERTPLGVLSGWLGILSAVLTAMILLALPFIVIAGFSLKGFPWVLPIVGLALSVVFFGYSRKTRHLVWRARD